MSDPFAALRKPEGTELKVGAGALEDARWPADANKFAMGMLAIQSWEVNPDGSEKLAPTRGLAGALVVTRYNENHDEHGRFATSDSAGGGTQGELPLEGGKAKGSDWLVQEAARLQQPLVKEPPEALAHRLGDPVDGPAVAEALASFETKGRAGRATETLTAIKPDGTVAFLREGTERYVEVKGGEVNSLEDSVLSHNHPNGSSFSPEDIMLAAHANAREIRAFGTNSLGETYLYTMTRQAGSWPGTIELIEAYAKADNAVRNKFTERIRSGKMEIAEANSTHHHEVWTRVIARLRRSDPNGIHGLQYARRKIKI